MELKAQVYDIECYDEVFVFVAYSINTKQYSKFKISAFHDDTYALIKYLNEYTDDYLIGFNNVSYDFQVIQYIYDHYEDWVNLTGFEKVKVIKKFSNEIIENQNYGLFPPYREESFIIKQIDLFKIHHFDNENRRTSLKWVQFSMDFPNVEETPIAWDRKDVKVREIDEIVHYCVNDVDSTYAFYLVTIGETTNELYAGDNKIQNRLDIIKEMGFEPKAMNWSDVKIGEQINLKTYCQLSGKTPADVYELKKRRISNAGFTFADCIPSYVKFKTPEFNAFFEYVKTRRVKLGGGYIKKKKRGKLREDAYPFTYNGTSYTIAQGGIHSNEKYRITIVKQGEICRDADVGSQYPHAIIKRGLFPSHLSKLWLIGYTGIRDKRLADKNRSKDSTLSKADQQKYKGLSEMGKLALNGGGFGKTNENTNWQYDPFVQFSCTIGNQFEILMLVEMMETSGIHCISANTDGIVCLFDNSLEDTYNKVCKEWEVIVGNSDQGKLEFADYTRLFQISVNDYLAVKVDKNGKTSLKKKGDFSTNIELNKNKSRLVVAKSLEKYFVEDVPVEMTIRSNKNIFDFCVGVKASRDYHYESIDKQGARSEYNRMIRYYITTDGYRLRKIKSTNSQSDGNRVTECEPIEWPCRIANLIDTGDHIKAYKINYDYYIQKAETTIRQMKLGKRKDRLKVITDKNQISLF